MKNMYARGVYEERLRVLELISRKVKTYSRGLTKPGLETTVSTVMVLPVLTELSEEILAGELHPPLDEEPTKAEFKL